MIGTMVTAYTILRFANWALGDFYVPYRRLKADAQKPLYDVVLIHGAMSAGPVVPVKQSVLMLREDEAISLLDGNYDPRVIRMGQKTAELKDSLVQQITR